MCFITHTYIRLIPSHSDRDPKYVPQLQTVFVVLWWASTFGFRNLKWGLEPCSLSEQDGRPVAGRGETEHRDEVP